MKTNWIIETAAISVTIAVVVTVASELGDPYADLMVYVFDDDTYTGFSGTSDADGRATFTLAEGDCHFSGGSQMDPFLGRRRSSS